MLERNHFVRLRRTLPGLEVLWKIPVACLKGVEFIIPLHTREAVLEIWSDLQVDTPKDHLWFQQTATKLRPRTISGWIALSALLLYGAAAVSLIGCSCLFGLACAMYAALALAMLAGLVTAFWALVISATCLIVALLVASVASCLAAGYATMLAVQATWRFLLGTIFRLAPQGGEKAAPEIILNDLLPPKSTLETKTTLGIQPEQIGSRDKQVSASVSTVSTSNPDTSILSGVDQHRRIRGLSNSHKLKQDALKDTIQLGQSESSSSAAFVT